MRLNNYLNENIDQQMEELKILIQQKCQPFIKDYKSTGKSADRMLYSGRGSRKDLYIERKVRKNRKPKDTPLVVHETLDELFYREFGIKARSQTLFTFPTWSQASYYGTPYMVFPVGKYEIIWSDKLGDLYGDLIEWMHDEIRVPEDEDFYYQIDSYWDELSNIGSDLAIKLANWLYERFPVEKLYHKGKLRMALSLNHEIMVHCDEWIGVNTESFRIYWKEKEMWRLNQAMDWLIN